MKFNININESNIFNSYLDKIKNKINVKEAMNKSTAIVLSSAKKNVPVDTGNLRNSIKTEIKSSKNEIKGIIYTEKEYAPYVEFGTGERGIDSNKNEKINVAYSLGWKGQAAQPFMYPALKRNEKKIKSIFKEYLE